MIQEALTPGHHVILFLSCFVFGFKGFVCCLFVFETVSLVDLAGLRLSAVLLPQLPRFLTKASTQSAGMRLYPA